MKLKLFNTLTKNIEEFKTLNNDLYVKMYSCGPTVYSYPHIGNMRAYVFTDTLKRVLLSEGYTVENAINLTDVGHLTDDANDGEDKLEKASKKEGSDVFAISKFYSEIFFRYLKELNILDANYFPKASDYIQEQIHMVELLTQKGYTYTTSDGVYFDTSKFPRYKELANISEEGLTEGFRVAFNDEKRNKTDFALWKFSKPEDKRQMEWNSPFGIGFPGWHIECSAMILKLLGQQIDIHTGGIDHIPVHHTNEIAQTEAYTGKKFANFWLHVNFLTPALKNDGDEEKMSKSLGNIYTIDDLKDLGYSPAVLKYYYLNSHYRSQLKFNFDILNSFKSSYFSLKQKVLKIYDQQLLSVETKLVDYLREPLLNDLNTVIFISRFLEIINNNDISLQEKKSVIHYFISITGLNDLFIEDIIIIPEEIIKLAEERKQAKIDKNYSKSDELRLLILEKGFILEDTKEGYIVKKI